MGSGFGIPATRDAQRARTIAREVQNLGFTSIWTNDIPKADGIKTAGHMAESTNGIRIGIGVVPCDRRPPAEIAEAVRGSGLPLDRLVLGLGAGFSTKPLTLTRESVTRLRDLLGPELRVGMAAMGRRMCRLGGEIADLVLLNWMVPERILWARTHVERGSSGDARPTPTEVAAYVRVALGPGSRERLRSEAERYYAMPAYRRHFQAMGEGLSSVGVAAEGYEPPPHLARYSEVLDELVIRALPESDSVASTLEVAEAVAPSRWL